MRSHVLYQAAQISKLKHTPIKLKPDWVSKKMATATNCKLKITDNTAPAETLAENEYVISYIRSTTLKGTQAGRACSTRKILQLEGHMIRVLVISGGRLESCWRGTRLIV